MAYRIAPVHVNHGLPCPPKPLEHAKVALARCPHKCRTAILETKRRQFLTRKSRMLVHQRRLRPCADLCRLIQADTSADQSPRHVVTVVPCCKKQGCASQLRDRHNRSRTESRPQLNGKVHTPRRAGRNRYQAAVTGDQTRHRIRSIQQWSVACSLSAFNAKSPTKQG